MPKSIVILTSKDINIEQLKEFSLTSNYDTVLNRNETLSIEKENNYILISISDSYIDLAIEDYLEFDNLNEHKIELIKNSSFISLQFNNLLFAHSYLNNFFKYFHNHGGETLIDDDNGNLFTIEEFKTKYLSHLA